MINPNSSERRDDCEVISAFTRAQAIDDGSLIDVSSTASEGGFRVPVALTASLWSLLSPSEYDRQLGQSIEGRLWDVLMVLRANAREADTIIFDVIVATAGTHEKVRLKAVIGPGDDGEPVVTIMLPNED